MKINWATSIIISFILFASFIGYFAFTIQTHDDYDYDLVTKNYYQEELNYNKNRIAQTNAKQYREALQIEKGSENLKLLNLPSSKKLKIKGYCPSDSKKDFLVEAVTDSLGILILSNQYFIEGNWTLTLNWNENNQAFQLEKKYYH